MKTSHIARVEEVYETFKVYAKDEEAEGVSVSELVADIHHMAGLYCRLVLGRGGGGSGIGRRVPRHT